MSPIVQVHDVNVSVHDNCNSCCPCLPKPEPKPLPDKPKDLTDAKVKRVSCILI